MSDIARRERTQRQRWAMPGGRHDRLIRLSLVALPLGIGVLAAFLVLAPLFMRGDVSFVLDKNRVEVAKERLRIQAARYTGQDAKGQSFALTAGSAVQKSSAEPIVQLDNLAAEIQLKEGPAQLDANHGRYDLNTEQVAIDGPIAFRTTDGYRLDTRDATLDLKSRKLQSAGAAEGTTPLGTFRGDRLSADLEARTVRLDGNARLRIMPGQTK
jgi:lipopolysaccharide export system protein LptC